VKITLRFYCLRFSCNLHAVSYPKAMRTTRYLKKWWRDGTDNYWGHGVTYSLIIVIIIIIIIVIIELFIRSCYCNSTR